MCRYILLVALVALPLNVLCQDDDETPCPPEGVTMRDSGRAGVHNGVCYYFMESPHKQGHTFYYCQRSGGRLVTSKTDDINDFLVGKMNEFGLGEVWLGLSDLIGKGNYWWSDTSIIEKDDYEKFADNNGPNPQGQSSTARDSCVFVVLKADDKQWYDISCDAGVEKSYVCQFD